MALMKLFFHPGTNMAQAMAETIGYVTRSRAFMPPGTVSPFITRFDAGSVPVGYLVLSSETKIDRRDPGPGAVQGPADVRQPAGRLGPAAVRRQPADRRRPRRPRPAPLLPDVARRGDHGPHRRATRSARRATSASATRCRSSRSTRWSGRSRSWRRSRSGPAQDPDGLPPRRRDRRRTPPTSPTGYALVNGRRAVYILVTKRADASTLSVVNNVKEALPRCRRSSPTTSRSASSSTSRRPSPTRCASLATEGALGAVLTGLMVLALPPRLAERHRRRPEHPVRPLRGARGALAHRADDQPDDARRPGAGRSASWSTRRPSRSRTSTTRWRTRRRSPLAVRQGNLDTAVPRLLAMLCILAVFIPSFFMQGAAQALFVPLVAGRRLRDGRVVPALQHVRAGPLGLAPPPPPPARGTSGRAGRSSTGLRDAYGRALRRVVRLRWAGRAGLPRRRGAASIVGVGRRLGPGDLPEGRRRPVPAPDQGPDRHADRGDRAARHRRPWRRSARRSGRTTVDDLASATSA